MALAFELGSVTQTKPWTDETLSTTFDVVAALGLSASNSLEVVIASTRPSDDAFKTFFELSQTRRLHMAEVAQTYELMARKALVAAGLEWFGRSPTTTYDAYSHVRSDLIPAHLAKLVSNAHAVVTVADQNSLSLLSDGDLSKSGEIFAKRMKLDPQELRDLTCRLSFITDMPISQGHKLQ